MNTHRRFKILRLHGFTCSYCGAKPGNERLQVDHMVSRARGGSDHDNNLTIACDRCNNGKSDSVAVPVGECIGTRDRDGWITWKAWGSWELKLSPDGEADEIAALTFQFSNGQEYWFGLSRVHENDWHNHIYQKGWGREAYLDFCDALEFARTLIEREAVASAA